MNNITSSDTRVGAMTAQSISKVAQIEAMSKQMPQETIHTQHVLHGGMYTRTILIRAGVMLTGVLIKCPTTLVICGDVSVYVGDSTNHIVGYTTLAASANRKQAFLAHRDTYLTMAFATSATTIEQAEAEFTDDTDSLMSRKPDAINHITITGE